MKQKQQKNLNVVIKQVKHVKSQIVHIFFICSVSIFLSFMFLNSGFHVKLTIVSVIY